MNRIRKLQASIKISILKLSRVVSQTKQFQLGFHSTTMRQNRTRRASVIMLSDLQDENDDDDVRPAARPLHTRRKAEKNCPIPVTICHVLFSIFNVVHMIYDCTCLVALVPYYMATSEHTRSAS